MRNVLALVALMFLAACADNSGPLVSDQTLEQRAFRAPDQPEITVLTMVNNTSGAGGHTSLLISGSQRVIFDPAGSFRHATVPERGDVLYGVSPGVEQGYKSAHARNSHHVVSQTFTVTPAQAERALQLAQSNGVVAGAFCTNASSNLLRQVPGFEDVKVTFYPVRLMEQLANRPGVVTDRYFENDAGDVVDGAALLQL